MPTRDPVGDADDVGYDDIGGYGKELDKIRRNISMPRFKANLFQQINFQPPNGLLLFGPSGSGKTLIGRAIKNEETDVLVEYVSCSEIVASKESMYEEEEEKKGENANPNQGEPE